MSLDELSSIANRAYSLVDDGMPEKAIDLLLFGADNSFTLAEETNESGKKEELVKLGKDFLHLAEEMVKDMGESKSKLKQTSDIGKLEGEKDWSFQLPTVTFDDVVGMDTLKKRSRTSSLTPPRIRRKIHLPTNTSFQKDLDFSCMVQPEQEKPSLHELWQGN